jgi:hypothetical protein
MLEQIDVLVTRDLRLRIRRKAAVDIGTFLVMADSQAANEDN